MAKAKPIIAIAAPVTVTAASEDADKKLQPATFDATFYTGGPLSIEGWDMPVVVDLAGLRRGNVLVANLDHDRTKRVGNFDVTNDGKTLTAHGTATAATAARDEVIQSAASGYQWQASLEVNPTKVEELKAGKSTTVNGQTIEGPAYITRSGTLKGFAFVSHGADDNTAVTIAASAAFQGASEMKAEVKAWAESMGIDVDNATPEQVATIEANYAGRNGKKAAKVDAANPFEERKIEAKRRDDIREIANRFIDMRAYDRAFIESVEKMYDHAIEANMTPHDFRAEMWEATAAGGTTVSGPRTRDPLMTNRTLLAAVCEAGRLSTLEKEFTDQELQAAHDRFPHGISLNELFILGAESNGYRTSGTRVTLEVQRAAFGMLGGPMQRTIHASGGGFSSIDVANIVAATANKFLHEGWMFVDQTPLRISRIRPVRNFQQITTVSLTGALQYTQLGADGEIKHGTLDDLTYTNQADTYAAMLAITRKDIINDDLGALTAAPRRLGRGGALKLNDIFWTEFLSGVSTNFFSSGNSNINTAVADMTIGGLAATETIFMNQTDPDGKPVGFTPAIILVPPALKATAIALMDPQSMMTGGSSNVSTSNPFRGRFRVESSSYISNSSYTGYTSQAWWMLADPNEEAVIEIAALNGRVEPTVDTAEAAFNVLGVQMRGYCDVGVNFQEYRAGVHADGNSS